MLIWADPSIRWPRRQIRNTAEASRRTVTTKGWMPMGGGDTSEAGYGYERQYIYRLAGDQLPCNAIRKRNGT